MRYLVLSDIHSNLEALQAVLDDAARRRWDRCLVLGDLVGYGADPNPVLDRLRELQPDQIIRGNHDKVVSGITDGSAFNPLALEAARWTQATLRDDHLRWLAELDRGPAPAAGDADTVLCHGSPVDEEIYILDEEEAVSAFDVTSFRFCLFGHTHYPLVVSQEDGGLKVRVPPGVEGGSVELVPGSRYLINPGSIGQPRDGNFRASYLILDTEAGQAEFVRVAYPVEMAMAKITEAGLPAPLALRLPRGI